MIRLYSITNPGGATYRIGPGTGSGILPDPNGGSRKAVNGTVVEVEAVAKGEKINDRWLLLSKVDPLTGKPWLYKGQETRVYIALYVGGTTYADPLETEASEDGKTYADGVHDAIKAIQALL